MGAALFRVSDRLEIPILRGYTEGNVWRSVEDRPLGAADLATMARLFADADET